MLLTAARLFDGNGAANAPTPWVQVAEGRIAAIGSTPQPTGNTVDFPGCTILPGLIDTHVHLVFSALSTHAAIIAQVGGESDHQLLHRASANPPAAFLAGITTRRDCGGRGRVVQAARDRIRSGRAHGADILACGAPITTTKGHCHWLGLIADGEAEAVAAAERMLREDADFLKVMATGGNMTPSSDP